MIEVLLLEDNKYTLEYIKNILLDMPEVTCVYDTSDAKEAIAIAMNYNPDLILLDIKLEGQSIDGIQVAAEINQFNQDTYVVFITGFLEPVLDSFDVHPYHYLIKPINIDKFTELIKEISTKVVKKRMHLQESLILKTKKGIVHIPKRLIVFIEKEHSECIIHTYDGKFQVRGSLEDLERKLSNTFIRLHRSFIINIMYVKCVNEIYDRSYEISFHGYSEKALMSRYQFKKYEKFVL